jgi:hypothetical protein
MFGLMLKSTHQAKLKEAYDFFAKTAEDLLELDQRALDAERSISASLRVEIEEMQPLYELGLKRRANYDNDNAKAKAERAAKRDGV